MPHAALCVLGPEEVVRELKIEGSFNAARSIVCVGTKTKYSIPYVLLGFNAARSIVCVGTRATEFCLNVVPRFNAARSIVCVGTF